jgi:hypothetical protein
MPGKPAMLVAALALVSCAPKSPRALLDRLPTKDATVLSVDFAALRSGGILKLLAGKAEPEYLAFVKNSGFDYQKDLDAALVSFGPNAIYFLVRGRFDWNRLETYARDNGGSCYNRLCHLPGSKPERRISFLPLSSNLMAMAVAGDDLAAARLRDKNPQRPIEIPSDPVWISAQGSALKQTPLFAAALGSKLCAIQRKTRRR